MTVSEHMYVNTFVRLDVVACTVKHYTSERACDKYKP